MKKLCTYISLSLALIISGCASMVPPAGGPPDITPPQLQKSSPPNYSVNFKGSSFTLVFDEFIDIKDPFNRVLISPPLAKVPDFAVKKKTLTVTFDEPLKEKTTYNINFGNSITDITEGNPLENFQYTFSTGDVLDSLEIHGVVRNALNSNPEKTVFVGLYKDTADSVPFKNKPDYFTKTNTEGKFRIRNLASGNYKIIAIKDINNNYLYEPGTEQIGFSDSPAVAGSIDSLRLSLFEERLAKLRLEKASSTEYGKILFVFNKPAPGLKFFSDIRLDTAGVIQEQSGKKDSLILWYSSLNSDSIQFILKGTGFSDTVKIALLRKDTGKIPKGKAILHKTLFIQSNLKPVMDVYEDINFVFNRPIRNYDLQTAELLEDSLPVKNYILVAKDSANRRFSIAYPWKETSSYSILIPKGSFTDILGNTNDTIKSAFTIKPAESYGNLTMKLNVTDTTRSYIIQLLDEKENLVRENSLNAPQTLEYKFLNPGKYRLRLIEDSNDNLKWDSGEYLKRIQPEKVRFYKETILIRENWDLELDWKI